MPLNNNTSNNNNKRDRDPERQSCWISRCCQQHWITSGGRERQREGESEVVKLKGGWEVGGGVVSDSQPSDCYGMTALPPEAVSLAAGNAFHAQELPMTQFRLLSPFP